MPLEELGLIDLVPAPDDRLRIVEHHQALGDGALREAEGVMVDGRRLADEERVELGQPPVVVGADDLHADPLTGRGACEAAYAPLVGGRMGIVFGPEDGHVVARVRAARDDARRPVEILACALDHELLVRFRDLGRRDGAHARQAPLLLLPREARTQEGRGELVEQRPAEAVVAPRHVLPEVHAQAELLRADLCERLLHEVVEVLRGDAQDRRHRERLERRHRREGPVAARGREERHVVADALVAVAAAHVEDRDALHVRVARLDEVRACGHDLDPLHVEGPALRILHNDKGNHPSIFLGVTTSRFPS